MVQQLLEQGHIYFFHRPRVESSLVRRHADITRFNIAAHPRRREKHRLIVIGEKRLPAVSGRTSPVVGFARKIGQAVRPSCRAHRVRPRSDERALSGIDRR
jgi:hypothetical protein